MSETPSRDDSPLRPAVRRRRFLGCIGTGVIAGLGGCGDGGGGDSAGGDGSTPGDEVSSTVVRGVERYDTTVVLAAPQTGPDLQFQRYSTLNPAGLNSILSFDLAGRSFGDRSIYGELVSDWTYDPGTLEITLHDDFRYWDGDPVDAENVHLHLALEDYALGTGDSDPHPGIDDVTRTGDHSVQFSLSDAWREEYALERSIGGWAPRGSTSYYGPWLEQFEDASNEDEILDVVRDLIDTRADDPDPFYNAPFRIVDVHESRITCELRLDEEPVPHYVDDINFETLEIRLVSPERQIERTDLFRQQWRPDGRVDEIDLNPVEFETVRAAFPPAIGPWSILFNCAEPPTSNVRFRRAIGFMTNREDFLMPDGFVPNERHTPFATRAREEAYVSGDVLADLEDVGWDRVVEDEADREMERGGFERNSEGRWLHRDGPHAGEPMELTVYASPAQGGVEQHGGQFRSALREWGLTVAIETAPDYQELLESDSGYTLVASNWGGGFPERAMELDFASESAAGGDSPRLPATVEAPPVGEPWPTVDDIETYDVRSMAETLRTTTDNAEYQRLVDRLTWVFNQTTPRLGIQFPAREYAFNTNRFDVAVPNEAPALWTRPPPDRLATTGIVEYVPTDER